MHVDTGCKGAYLYSENELKITSFSIADVNVWRFLNQIMDIDMLQEGRNKRKHGECEDSDDEFYTESEMNAEKELSAVVSKMKQNLPDLTDNIINIYVDLLFPSMERRQRAECSGCIHGHGRDAEHDCLEIPEKDFLEKCLTEVGL